MNYSQQQLQAKLVKTLDLSKAIISGSAQLPMIEMNLNIKNTLELPLIRSVFKNENGPIGYAVVNVLVNRFLASFGFSTKPSETIIEAITVDTLDNFSYESLEDIILFFKMCRQGAFGTTTKGLDSNFIYGEWFPQYMAKKAEIRETQYLQQKSEGNSTANQFEEYYKKRQLKKAKEAAKKQTEFEIDEMVKKMDRQMLEDTIASWEKKPEMLPYLDYLRKKRLEVKGDYKF